MPCVVRFACLITPLTVTAPWPSSLSRMARTTAWFERDALLQPTSQKQPADLRAEESVRQHWVAAVAVGESDELDTVDDDHVTLREHDVVHAVHVVRGGAADAAVAPSGALSVSLGWGLVGEGCAATAS